MKKSIRIPRRKSLYIAGISAGILGVSALGGTAFAADSHSGAPAKATTQYVQTDSKGKVSHTDKAPTKAAVPAHRIGEKTHGKYVTADRDGHITYTDKMPSGAGVPAAKKAAGKAQEKYVTVDRTGKVTYADTVPGKGGVPAHKR